MRISCVIYPSVGNLIQFNTCVHTEFFIGGGGNLTLGQYIEFIFDFKKYGIKIML
jgi:hypothetical protein